MKLLLDEQISGRVAQQLRDRGHDVSAVVADPDLRGLSDPTIFKFAQAGGRELVTYNYLDFIELAREHTSLGEDHHGLIIVHATRLPNWELARLTNELEHFLKEFTPHAGRYACIPLP